MGIEIFHGEPTEVIIKVRKWIEENGFEIINIAQSECRIDNGVVLRNSIHLTITIVFKI